MSCCAAGRSTEQAYEDIVLHALRQLGDEMRAGFERIEAAIATLGRDTQ